MCKPPNQHYFVLQISPHSTSHNNSTQPDSNSTRNNSKSNQPKLALKCDFKVKPEMNNEQNACHESIGAEKTSVLIVEHARLKMVVSRDVERKMMTQSLRRFLAIKVRRRLVSRLATYDTIMQQVIRCETHHFTKWPFFFFFYNIDSHQFLRLTEFFCRSYPPLK